jgi:hypothetical protein
MPGEAVVNIKSLIRELNQIQPKLATKLRNEAKAPAKPLTARIKSVIRSITPLSGMRTKGRLGWGMGKPADHTLVRFNASYSRTKAITPLVSVWVDSPMTAVADVAGRGSNRKAKTVTRPYPYKNGKRTHTINGGNGGDIFVSNLKSKRMNNFVYPAVEASLPDVEREIKLVIRKFEAELARKI